MLERSPIHPPVALTIAGFDPSSGAGVTADLQVFAAHGLFGTSCITAMTVQSTQGVSAVESLAHLIAPTLEELEADLPPAGIKIGMLATAEAVSAVAAYLRERRGPKVPVVIDPVLRSSSGARLLSEEGTALLKRELLPLVDWVTPNWDELAELTGVVLSGNADAALRELGRCYPHLHIVATGGDQPGNRTLETLLMPSGEVHRFSGERIDTTSTHGTGCAFSSALLSRLVLGAAPQDAVAGTKNYVAEAIRWAPGLGKGRGPLNLLWPLQLR